LAELPKV